MCFPWQSFVQCCTVNLDVSWLCCGIAPCGVNDFLNLESLVLVLACCMSDVSQLCLCNIMMMLCCEMISYVLVIGCNSCLNEFSWHDYTISAVVPILSNMCLLIVVKMPCGRGHRRGHGVGVGGEDLLPPPLAGPNELYAQVLGALLNIIANTGHGHRRGQHQD